MRPQQASPPQTYSEAIMDALDRFWFRGQPHLATALIGILLDWREDQVLMARTGEDGAL